MVNELFQFEQNGNSLIAVPRWQLAPGYVTCGLTFAGSTDAIHVATNAQANAVTRKDLPPATANQRAEIAFTYSTTTSATVGVLLRMVDGNNYVTGQVSGVGSLVVTEYVAGVGTTICTAANPGNPSGVGCIRVEAIGKRIRAWFEAGTAIQDRPPDVGGNLSESVNIGGWGIYMQSGGSNTAQINRFAANGMPSRVLPAPNVVTFSNASGYNFTPITVTQSGLTGGFYTEWEVLPVDAADFPEPYRDRSNASITSRVLFVRSGYNYDCRARELNGAGGGAWTEYMRVNAIGSPGGTGQATQQVQADYWSELPWSSPASTGPPAGITFSTYLMPDIIPDYVFDSTDTAQPSAVIATSGRESVSSRSIRPRRSFVLDYHNRTNDEYQVLIDFFEAMQAMNQVFNWPHPISGELFSVRFARDNYQVNYDDEGISNSTTLASPITSLTLEIAEAAIAVVPSSLNVSLVADPSLV